MLVLGVFVGLWLSVSEKQNEVVLFRTEGRGTGDGENIYLQLALQYIGTASGCAAGQGSRGKQTEEAMLAVRRQEQDRTAQMRWSSPTRDPPRALT